MFAQNKMDLAQNVSKPMSYFRLRDGPCIECSGQTSLNEEETECIEQVLALN